MGNVTTLIEELLYSDTYLARVNQLTNQPVARIRQVHQLLTNLLIACLHRQLKTDIGRTLIYKIITNHARSVENRPSFWLSANTDLVIYSVEGNRLLNTIIPGRKSAIVCIATRYTKFPFAEIDLVVGLCADVLFTSLAFELIETKDKDVSLLLPALHELVELAPDLTKKDYASIGIYIS